MKMTFLMFCATVAKQMMAFTYIHIPTVYLLIYMMIGFLKVLR